jgi:DNA-binding transcriptional ArsR family regulator
MSVEIPGKVLEMPAAGAIELPEVLHALSDPVRLEIVRALAAGGEQACGAVPLPVSASTRSHHFKILRDAGLTVTRLAGTQRLVSLRSDDLQRRFPGLLDAVLRG